MWLLVVLTVLSTANAVDFKSLEWAEGSSPNLYRSPNGGDFKGFKPVMDKDTAKTLERSKRMLHGQDYLFKDNVPKYLVRIVRATRHNNTKLTWCSGSIIAPNLVLTAAWCVMDKSDKYWRKSIIPFGELQLIAGDYDMQVDEASEQILEPIQYHVYPHYKYTVYRNDLEFDFSIIQTKENFTYNERVDQIEIWTDPLPEVNTSISAFLWFKMSGFGEAKIRDDLDTNMYFAVTEGEQYYPRYQYYAWIKEGSNNCEYDATDGDLPEFFGYQLPYTDKSKVCMFTGLLTQVTYQPCSGDWGAPITWFNHSANQEYLMMIAPFEPVTREVERVRLEAKNRWGVRVGYYQNFTDQVMAMSSTDFYSELDVSSVKATENVNFTLNDYKVETYNTQLDNEKHFKQYTFFLTADSEDSYVNVDISYTTDSISESSANTTIYVRNGTGGGDVIYHFIGGFEDIDKTVYGISNEMTIEVHIIDYDVKPPVVTVGIGVDYWTTNTMGSNTADICYPGYLLCEDKSYCVDTTDVCDLEYDCLDGLDETLWCLGTTCKSSEYRCSTGECIPTWKACDGTCDCADTALCEDESSVLMCVEDQFNEKFPKKLGSNAMSRSVNIVFFGLWIALLSLSLNLG